MQELTPETVRLAYALFLGRAPENEAVVTGALAYGTVDRLRAAFLAASEFRGIMADALGRAPTSSSSAKAASLVGIGAPPIDVEWQVDGTRTAAILAHVRRTWTALGLERPHWSVLSSQAFTPEEIERNGAAFYQSGAQDVAALSGILRRHGVTPADIPRVYEYGCGIGRVTPHLAAAFAHVDACDVSTSHKAMAQQLLDGRGARNVALHLVEDESFGMSEPFDLWFSRIVLQHNPPPIIALILRRALALLAPGGLAVFQVPTYAVGYAFRAEAYLAGLSATGQIEMHVLPQPVVFQLARDAGCDVLEVLEDLSAGPSSHWNSTTFVLRKRGA